MKNRHQNQNLDEDDTKDQRKHRKSSFVLWGHIIYQNLRLGETNGLVQKLDFSEQLVKNEFKANLKTVRD